MNCAAVKNPDVIINNLFTNRPRLENVFGINGGAD